MYTVVKEMAKLPKGALLRGHDKPIHGSCAIYFPGETRKKPSYLPSYGWFNRDPYNGLL